MILGIWTKDRDFLPDNYSNRTFEMQGFVKIF